MSAIDWKKIAIVGGSILTVGFVALLVKNTIAEKGLQPIEKAKLQTIIKKIRKERYVVIKQIATFVVQMIQQFKNNLTVQAIEGYLSSPESPINIKTEFEKITSDVCESLNQTLDSYNFSLDAFKEDPQIIDLLQILDKDYDTGLKGRVPHFEVAIPSSLTKEKLIEVHNRITKKKYFFQCQLFKLLQEHSEEELQQNPQLAKQLGNPEKDTEQLLEEEGIGSEEVPASAVFEQAIMKYKNDQMFKTKVMKIQQGYGQILNKYAMKMRSKRMTEQDLTTMENQISMFEPI